MKAVRLLRLSEQEMLEAVAYDDLQVPGLGDAFLDKVGSALNDIAENAERWPIIRLNGRRRLVHRFPYALLYRVEPDEVVVLAVAHLHRHPSYWIGRI